MIDPTKAEQAADFLRETAKDMEALWKQARLKESMLKHTEALLIKSFNDMPVSIRQAHARAEPRYLEALTEDAEAVAALKGLEARRDAAKILIGLYQSQVKDRL